jgi:hypothetical protein
MFGDYKIQNEQKPQAETVFLLLQIFIFCNLSKVSRKPNTSTMAKIASTRSGFASSKTGFVLTKAKVASSHADENSRRLIQIWCSTILSQPFHW